MVSIGIAILFTANHNADVVTTVGHLGQQGVPRSHIMLFHGSPKPPSLELPDPVNVPNAWTAATLSRTYAWVFREAAVQFDYTVVLEDDLWLSPHFMKYMRWGVRVLRLAPDVGVVSAWNDNAVPEAKLSPSLAWRATQFMGLGWVASSRTLTDFAAAIDATPSRPWDLTVARHMFRRRTVSVFPQFPRVHHRTPSFWKFDTLQVFPNATCTMPGARWFSQNYTAYIQSICRIGRVHAASNLVQAIESSGLPIPWTTSALTSRAYGEHGGITIFSDREGTQHLFLPPSQQCMPL